MNCYLDSSVVLRILFDEPDPLKEWADIVQGFSSRLLKLECFRSIDRQRLANRIDDADVAEYTVDLNTMLAHIGLLPITEPLLESAERSFQVRLGTLDSMHLATALAWRETRDRDLVIATHDIEMGRAAQTLSFQVIGL